MNKLFLSVDGGGALGIGPAEFMCRIDKYYGVIPDVYAGTSVGALLIAMAAVGYSWAEIRDVFIKECPKIFQKPSIWWRINPTKPRYDGKALKQAAKRYLGNIKLKDLKKPVFIPAFDFHIGRPKVFDIEDNVYLWYAVICSAAAPLYFPPIDNRYGDGGLIANNPAMIGYCGSKDKLKIKDLYCLSLGTNGYSWKDPHVGNKTIIGWIAPLIKTFLGGNEELATYQLRTLIDDRMLRIEPVLDNDINLDDYETALDVCPEIWKSLFYSNINKISMFLDQLEPV